MKNKMLNALTETGLNQRFAVGNDLVFIPAFKNALTTVFKNKVYTPGEITYCDQFDDALLRYASTWAAKEAVYKAVKQLSPATLAWKKIEITRQKAAGQPNVTLHQYPKQYNISLTLSHDGDYAWAIAFIERENIT